MTSEERAKPEGGEGGQSRTDRIARIVADCANRLNAGEEVDVHQVMQAHPDLAADLSEALSALGDVRLTFTRPHLPDSFGDYKIVRELGRGGMGVVYEALQLPLNRRVALKMLPPELLPHPRAMARFQHEARVASSLDSNRELMIRQKMVEEGNSREEAEAGIGMLITVARHVRSIAMHAGTENGQAKMAIQVDVELP